MAIDTAADTFSCAIPRYRFHSKKIAAMATVGSGELALLLDAGGVRPVSVAVNGEECPFERFVDGRLGRPEALVAHSGRAVRMGGHVVAEVVFADGTSRFACAKAMAAPCIEMPGATAKEARRLGVPSGKSLRGIVPDDVGCYDLESGHFGASLTLFFNAIARAGGGNDGQHESVSFCRSAALQTFDAYGAIGDAAQCGMMAFRDFGSSPSRLGAEERAFANAQKAVRPSPLLWSAYLFGEGNMAFSTDEAEALFWETLAMGGKGAAIHGWGERPPFTGLEAKPELQEAVRRFAKAARRHRRGLSRLLPCGVAESDGIILWTAWNPGVGMLAVWRTKDFSPLAEDVSHECHLPEWLSPRRVRDIAADRRTVFAVKGQMLQLELRKGSSFGALWIE